MTADPPPPPAATAQPYRWRWLALLVILTAEIMDLLDALVTTIAAPAIRADLGGSAATIQWLGAGYTLAMAVGLITGGRLGDLYGRRRMFLIGAAGFTLASALCGFAQSPEALIGSRVLQGLFGAVLIPQGLGLIREMFQPREMAAAFGAFGPVMGLASVGGPILAGWLVDADLFGAGWRMIFLINVPIGALAIIGAARLLPESRAPHAQRLDLIGALLASLAAFAIVYPLVQGRELDWPAWTFGSMLASVALFAVFGWYEVRRQRSGGDPLVVPALFRKRGFTGGLVTGLAFFSAMVGFSLVFSLYTQLGLGYSPLKAGLAGVPLALAMVVGFIVAGNGLAERFGRRLVHGGTAIAMVGVGILIATLHLSGTTVGPWRLAPALAVTGLGMALVMAPFFDIVLAGVEPAETGSASGALTAIQQLGSALGFAVLGTVFFDLLEDAVVGGATNPAEAITSAMTTTLWAELGLLAAAFVAAFLLPTRARHSDVDTRA